ncbi:MAG: hypothetical protein EOO47_00040 [Flavobacterium sp.]|nr:MAG: hypothetical protein EOO47_00040 [Flavobacterium sp.]
MIPNLPTDSVGKFFSVLSVLMSLATVYGFYLVLPIIKSSKNLQDSVRHSVVVDKMRMELNREKIKRLLVNYTEINANKIDSLKIKNLETSGSVKLRQNKIAKFTQSSHWSLIVMVVSLFLVTGFLLIISLRAWDKEQEASDKHKELISINMALQNEKLAKEIELLTLLKEDPTKYRKR